MGDLEPRMLLAFLAAAIVAVSGIAVLIGTSAWWALPIALGALVVGLLMAMWVIGDAVTDHQMPHPHMPHPHMPHRHGHA